MSTLTDQEIKTLFDNAAKMHVKGIKSFKALMFAKKQTIENPTMVSIARALYDDYEVWLAKQTNPQNTGLALYLNILSETK